MVQGDNHLFSVIRYVERNALQANLVEKAENWRFCSLARRLSENKRKKRLLSEWPILEPKDYLLFVNMPLSEEEENTIKVSIARGKPFGNDSWSSDAIKKFGLASSYPSSGTS